METLIALIILSYVLTLIILSYVLTCVFLVLGYKTDPYIEDKTYMLVAMLSIIPILNLFASVMYFIKSTMDKNKIKELKNL